MIRLLAAIAVACVAAAPAPSFTSLVPQFDAVASRAADRPEAERVAAFKAQVAPLLPDFYAPRGRSPEKFNTAIARAMASWPVQREAVLAAARLVESARAAAGAKFARTFPDYRMTTPVYLLHSLGEMDGGVREIAGRPVLIFGADVIAQHHDAASIGPLFDHELFHTYHQQAFAGCPQVWCSLWAEGLATFVAAQMNPGADDRALLLALPAPIRAEVDRRWPEAIATMRAALDAEDGLEAERMFSSGNGGTGLPERWGYYLGMRVAAQLAKTYSLAVLAKMPPAQVRPLIEKALEEMATPVARRP